MTTLLWPIGVLPVPDLAINIAPRNTRGGASVSTGSSQIVASDAGFWTATLGSVVIRNRASVLAWQALQDLLQGGLNPILIPFCRGYQPVPDDADYSDIPHDDGSFFDDGTGYAAHVIHVTLAAAAAVRATELSLSIGNAATLEAGQKFSIGERLYRIAKVIDQTSTTATITTNLPLREAVASGEELNFDDPVGRFRLASDNGMDAMFRLRKYDRPSPVFVEDI